MREIKYDIWRFNEIVDGYHRYTVMLTHKDIYEREQGLLPVSVIDKPISDRMASTIRHNRARGEHFQDFKNYSKTRIFRKVGNKKSVVKMSSNKF